MSGGITSSMIFRTMVLPTFGKNELYYMVPGQEFSFMDSGYSTFTRAGTLDTKNQVNLAVRYFEGAAQPTTFYDVAFDLKYSDNFGDSGSYIEFGEQMDIDSSGNITFSGGATLATLTAGVAHWNKIRIKYDLGSKSEWYLDGVLFKTGAGTTVPQNLWIRKGAHTIDSSRLVINRCKIYENVIL